jgi:uncharacterized protein YbjT (DUF2867 family)
MSEDTHNSEPRLILLTGATGYVGGRLLSDLEERSEAVRCLARRPENLQPRVGPTTEVFQGDVMDIASLAAAMQGVHTAYYLVHAMGSEGDFETAEETGARNFASAALHAGVRRIVYVGGLAHGNDLSKHLRSRHRVGDILRDSGVLTIEFRASIVIGSGSASFDMVRSLVEKLPIMVTPSWVRIEAQPIAIEDLVAYLVAALEIEVDHSQVFEIGGAERVSYGEIMGEYARQRGLRRLMIPIPVLSPRLSSLWLGLVTPVHARIGRKLVEGLKNPTVVRDPAALDAFQIEPRGLGQAISRALIHEDRELAETRWSDALSSGGDRRPWGGMKFGSRIVDSHVRDVEVPCARSFAPIQRIGGQRGWYSADRLWRLRGWLDRLVGGVGLRRGRPDPEQVHVGDLLDFWRVEAFEPDRLLRLRAEMKMPGRAWLQFEVEPSGSGSRIRQTTLYDPAGLFGLLYWYLLYPVHAFVYSRMADGIAAAAANA